MGVGRERLEEGEDMEVVRGETGTEVGGFEGCEEAVRHFAKIEGGAVAG